MKFFSHIRKNALRYHQLIQQVSNVLSTNKRKTKKIYNLGTLLEAVDLVNYKTEELPDEKFLVLSRLEDPQQFRDVLSHIMVPRIVGSTGHQRVRTYITDTLKELGWTVTLDSFNQSVPLFGRLQFHNIIATLNPRAERYLILACHYDSKYMPDYEFIGATDSAVPCAMLVNLAQVLHEHLQLFRQTKLSLMLLFFDGEEAFKSWGPTDSIYGARHLARKWEAERFLDKIDMLVLIDLIGAPDPQIYSYFYNTEAWFSRLLSIEQRLSTAGLLEKYYHGGVIPHQPTGYFQPRAVRNSGIEDDHLPFLRKNVPILHIIPTPFPSVWHTKNDDASAVDYATTANISRIINIFTMEYLLSYKL